jgi:hypothetical protein
VDEKALIEELQKTGHLTLEQVSRWRDSSGLLAVFDAIGRDGANAMVKVDGGRSDGSVYTVVVSGGRLGEDFFRKDGANLNALLEEAISFYRARVWSHS